jgi:sulfite exporter TauE/SafE
MIELPFVFLAGVLGTAHCLGMCGPMVIGLSTGSSHWSRAFVRQLCYSGGRIFTYTSLGLLAGYCGEWAARHSASLINVPAVFAILAGTLFIVKGFQETGLTPRIRESLAKRFGWRSLASKGPAPHASCGAGLLFAPFFRGKGNTGAFVAGVCTGFLPCGLLYGMLTLAASTHHVLLGGVTMLVFGLGTTPLLVLAGTSGQLLSLASRRWLFAVAAWCLMLTGVVSVVRGATHLSWGDRPAAGCPLCAAKSAAK